MISVTVTKSYCKIILNEVLAEFPAASVTVQVTVVVPIGKIEPDV